MSMIDEEVESFNEGQAIMDALSGGKKIRSEKITAINRKQRKYKGIYRVSDGTRSYWMLDPLGNPQLRLEEQTIIRLTPDGVRVFFPEWLPQNTVVNRVSRVLPEYGWSLEWNANRELVFVRAGKKSAFMRNNGLDNWWRTPIAQKREFYTESATRFENNMLIPYITVEGNCERVDYPNGYWKPGGGNYQGNPCTKKATEVSRWGEVVCSEHSRGY